MLQNEVHMNKYGVEEKVKDNGVIIEKSLQDKMTVYFLDPYHNKDIKFYRVISNSLQWHGRETLLKFWKKN